MKATIARTATFVALLCAGTGAGAQDRHVNVYNWSDYIGAKVNDAFTAESGIAVNYDVFDSADTMETKLVTGQSGYDVVVVTGSHVKHLVAAKALMKLDPGKLSNLKNIDANVLRAMQAQDPRNEYGVPYFWGTTGIGYNEDKIKARMADAPVSSLQIVFDPKYLAKFKDCGIAMLDAPDQIVPMALNYLGIDPHSEKAADLAKAEELLMQVRPYIRYFHSSRYLNDLADGSICLAIGWSSDVFVAKSRAADAKNGVHVAYRIPKEGTIVWIDNLTIPADAPDPDNAYKYIDNLLSAKVAGENATELHAASPNKAALDADLIPAEDHSDPGIYPSPSTMEKLFGEAPVSLDYSRLRTRSWTKITTGE